MMPTRTAKPRKVKKNPNKNKKLKINLMKIKNHQKKIRSRTTWMMMTILNVIQMMMNQ